MNWETACKILGVCGFAIVLTGVIVDIHAWEERITAIEALPATTGPDGLSHFHDPEYDDMLECLVAMNRVSIGHLEGRRVLESLYESVEEDCDVDMRIKGEWM